MPSAFITYTGPYTFDMSNLAGKLFDLEAGGRRGLRADQDGFGVVVQELKQSVPTAGVTAGIPQDVYEHFLMCNDIIDQIDEKLTLVKKQAEVLEESRALHVDTRQNDISIMVDAMKSRGQRRKDESTLLPFEKTIKYNSQNAEKAARTRRRNAEQAEEAAGTADAQETIEAEVQKRLAVYKAELDMKFHEMASAVIAIKGTGDTPFSPS
jgi:hypothetical protein